MSADPNPVGSPTPEPTPTQPDSVSANFKSVTGDAFGLGIALVVLPSLALYGSVAIVE